MNRYAEASAAVAWLLDEECGDRAWDQPTAAATVHTSDLTLIECGRAFRRAAATRRSTADQSSRPQTIVDTRRGLTGGRKGMIDTVGSMIGGI